MPAKDVFGTEGLWTESGANIYRNSSVGIGIESPTEKLSVSGNFDLESQTPELTGNGFSNAAVCRVKIAKTNDFILTTIYIDLTGITSQNLLGRVIGDGASDIDAYITKVTTAKNGFIYRAEMACIGDITTGEDNLDLVSDTVSRAAGFNFGTIGTEKYLLVPGATWEAGEEEKSLNGAGTANKIPAGLNLHYIYLVTAAGGGGSSAYSSGKFLIKLYGATI